MGRPLRAAAGGLIYHGWHRANGRPGILETAGDYKAFKRVLVDAHDRVAIRPRAYGVMANHWHFVVGPRRDGDLSRVMAWLPLTHPQRWPAQHQSAGLAIVSKGALNRFLGKPRSIA